MQPENPMLKQLKSEIKEIKSNMPAQKTIKDVLLDSVELLKTDRVVDHIRACMNISTELSMIPAFDPDPINAVSLYRVYLIDKHQATEIKLGLLKKIQRKIKTFKKKLVIRDLIAKSKTKEFGDGNEIIQEIITLIDKSL